MLTVEVIESVSDYVIDLLKRRNITLTEGTRQYLINVALSTEQRAGLRIMRETIEWELRLLNNH